MREIMTKRSSPYDASAGLTSGLLEFFSVRDVRDIIITVTSFYVPQRSLCALRARLHAAMRNVSVTLTICGVPVCIFASLAEHIMIYGATALGVPIGRQFRWTFY